MIAQTQQLRRPKISFPWGGHGDKQSLRKNYDNGRINVGDTIVHDEKEELVYEVVYAEQSNAGIFIRYMGDDRWIKDIRYSPDIAVTLVRMCITLSNPRDGMYEKLHSKLQKAGLT